MKLGIDKNFEFEEKLAKKLDKSSNKVYTIIFITVLLIIINLIFFFL